MSALPQTAPETPILLRDDRDGIATLTLNRPAQRNALSVELMAALQDELDRLKTDASVKVVVIAGAGPGFCGGHDLKEMRATPARQAYEALFAQCSNLMLSIIRLPKPVIAKVHAIAAAAGCQLVATCDLAVAAESARFAVNGVNIGLFCSTPMVALTRAIGRKPAMEMLLTGDLIDARTALDYGLVNKVVPDGELDDAVDTLARKIVAKSPLALAIGKEAFYKQAELGIEDAYKYASDVMTRNMLARDAERGIDAFIAKQPMPKWERTLTRMATKLATKTAIQPAKVDHDNYTDGYLRDILRRVKTIAMVGASPNWNRPSFFAMKYLQHKGYRVIPVNPVAAGQEILGEKVYASLKEVPIKVDMVDIFRNSAAAGPIVDEAIAIAAPVVWMQLGVRNDAAAARAEAAGATVVMNRCPKIEYGRLHGELSWGGINSGIISSKRQKPRR